MATGKAIAIKLPPVSAELERVTADERAFYDGFAGLDLQVDVPKGVDDLTAAPKRPREARYLEDCHVSAPRCRSRGRPQSGRPRLRRRE